MEHLEAQLGLIVTRERYKTARKLIGITNQMSTHTHCLSHDYIATAKRRAFQSFNEARQELMYAIKRAETLCGIKRRK